MEPYRDAGPLALYGGDPQSLTHGFEGGVLQKVFYGGRRRAETVLEFFADVQLVFFGSDRGDAFVGAQAKIFARDVVLRDAHVKAQAERGAQVRGDFFALQLGNGALQHLAIHIEADRFDVAVLLAAEHVAGAAKLEIECGNAESGTQFAEFLHGGEAFAGDVGERGVRRDKQIGVGALGGASDAAAQLVELRQPQAVGAVDQNGVGARDVQSVLDDGRRHQHVRFIADEFQHHAFEFFFGHLTVGHDHPSLGDKLGHHGSERINRFDAVVNEEDLAVTGKFGFDGALQQLFLKGGDDSLNGQAVARRRFDDGHVAKANKGHVQRARNRRRREGERVHVFAHFLESLFVGNAEALFFIYDEKTEVGKFHIFRKQPVGADDHVHLARFQIGENFFLLRGAAEAAEHFDARGEGGESFLERFEMLEGEHGGRRENSHLLVVHHGFERRAHGDLCFAVADVAAQEAVQGNVEACIVSVPQQHELAAVSAGFDLAKPLELPDAVIDMDHIVARLQLGKIAEETGSANLATGPLDCGCDVEKIGVAEERKPSTGKRNAFREGRADQQHGGGFVRGLCREAGGGVFRFAEHVGHFILAADVRKAFDLSGACGRQENRSAGSELGLHVSHAGNDIAVKTRAGP